MTCSNVSSDQVFNNYFKFFSRLWLFSLLVRATLDADKYRAFVEYNRNGRTEILRQKPIRLPYFFLHISLVENLRKKLKPSLSEVRE
jgi:hypothetical protein